MNRVYTEASFIEQPKAEITYRFRCPVCDFIQDVKARDEIPDKCPSCEKPQTRKKAKWIERPREREL